MRRRAYNGLSEAQVIAHTGMQGHVKDADEIDKECKRRFVRDHADYEAVFAKFWETLAEGFGGAAEATLKSAFFERHVRSRALHECVHNPNLYGFEWPSRWPWLPATWSVAGHATFSGAPHYGTVVEFREAVRALVLVVARKLEGHGSADVMDNIMIHMCS